MFTGPLTLKALEVPSVAVWGRGRHQGSRMMGIFRPISGGPLLIHRSATEQFGLPSTEASSWDIAMMMRKP